LKKTSGSAIFSTNRNSLLNSDKDNEYFNFLNLINNEKNKIPNLKVSYKEYFYSVNKCDMCDQTGITNDELKRMSNKTTILDAVVLDYILYQCSVCKVNIHKNCGYEIQNFPEINLREKMMMNNITWVCDKCKSHGLSEKSNQEVCQICWKKENQLKKPHLYKQLLKDLWVHNWCLLWLMTNLEEEDVVAKEESITKKLKEFYLNNNNYSPCYRCQDPNLK
jgi:hypothetical protein